ncbi:MAG TPA: TonB-dependent receptor [Gammaproteobacteria bacterium]
MSSKIRSTLALGFLVLVASPHTHAQPPAEAPSEEIIVRATRLEKPLETVPAAITVVGRDDIQLGRQQLALDEPLSRVPGVYMQDRFNFAQDLRISIRGFGARANFGIQGVKILVDGIPETLPDGQGSVDSIDLGATSEIEVLRGPSSSLWGNASGGVISVTSEVAPDEPFTEIRLTAGEDDFEKVQLKTGGQGDKLGYSFSLSDSSYEGYRAQSLAENTQLTGRLSLDLGRDRELLTVLNYTDQPVSDDPGGLTLAEVNANRAQARLANVTFDAGEFLEQSRIGFVYNTPIGEKGHISARNYYAWRDFGNKLAGVPVGGAIQSGIVALDRFFMGGGVNYTYDGMLRGRPNQLIVGLDIDEQDDDRIRYDNLPGGVQGPMRFNQNEAVSGYGVFVQNDLALTDNIDLSFGVRFDKVEFDVTDHFFNDALLDPTDVVPDDSGVVDFDDASPMLGIVFSLTDNLSLYGTYSSAFETPTTTQFARPDNSGGLNTALDPQVATNLEVGVRGGFGAHSFEAAFFSIDVDDELVQFESTLVSQRFYFQNAGKSARDGIELSLTLNPTERLRAIVSYTNSDFKFDEFTDGVTFDYSGNVIPGVPDELLFGELMYRHERGWYAGLDFVATGEQYADNGNTVLIDSYTLVNLRLGWNKELDSMTISPFLGVNNLNDEIYYGNIRINAAGSRYYEPAPGSNVYAGIGISHRHR